MSNRLGGKQGTAYTGTNANQPPNWTFSDRDPNQYDIQNVSLGDMWLNQNNEKVWVLVSLAGDMTSKGSLATWTEFGVGGRIDTLTGDTGGAVGPDVNANVNILSAVDGLSFDGNPGTNTITLNSTGSGIVQTLTGNTGGAVSPNMGNINIVGDDIGITIVGNPGTNTLTASLVAGSDAQSFPTDNNTAIPVLGVLNINANNAAQHAGSSVSFSATSNTVLFNITDANNNTIIGEGAGNGTLMGTNNTSLGEGSSIGLTTGSSNIIIGKDAGTALTTESSNIVVGHAGKAGWNNSLIIAIPGGSPIIMWDGSDELYVGSNSGNINTSAANNLVCGSNSLSNVTTASQNILFGNRIMTTATTTGADNCVVGGSAMNVATGNNNCVVGNNALIKATTASTNTVLGNDGGYSAIGNTGLTTGSSNILIGNAAGSAYTGNESNNIIIGMSGVAGESNKTKIAGIRGATTTNNNAIAVLIDSAGQLGTVSSSIRYKENVKDMGSSSNDIMRLRPVTFSYKEDSAKSISYGFIAEEVEQIFPDLVVYNPDGQVETVKYHLLSPIMLNEMQKLLRRIEQLEEKLKE